MGLPLHLSGDESEKSGEARRFAVWLSQITGLPHGFQDGNVLLILPGGTADDRRGFDKKERKDRIDKLAAQILLQTFLEARQNAKLKPPVVLEDADDDTVTPNAT